MKSLKQIADEMGESKQRVSRYVAKAGIEPTQYRYQTRLYDEKAEKAIKQGMKPMSKGDVYPSGQIAYDDENNIFDSGLKTIKQIAAELGESKQRVYRFALRQNIKPAEQRGKTWYYDKFSEECIKQAIYDANNAREQRRKINKKKNEINSVISYNANQYSNNNSLVEFLQQQLTEKDRQIAEQNKQIHELYEYLHNFM